MMTVILSSMVLLVLICDTEATRRLAQVGPQFPAVLPPVNTPSGPVAPLTPTEPAVIPIVPITTAPGAGPLVELICNDRCVSTVNCPSTCAQTMRTIENPPIDFTMECMAIGACAASQYTFTYVNGRTEYLESITAGAQYALYGSTFTFDNMARGNMDLVVRSIECGSGWCGGATFKFLNAEYDHILCDVNAGCGSGCMVEMPPDAPVACDQVATFI